MILNGWAVREEHAPDLFFVGENAAGKPVFEPLNRKTRTKYKCERDAQCACQRIRETGYEGNPQPFFLDNVEVLDEAPQENKPSEAPPEQEPPSPEEESPYEMISSEVLKPPPGWRILDFFGKNLALLYDKQRFAIRYKDGSSKLYDSADEAAAVWCKERTKILTERLSKLGGAG